ncbi:alpha/beta hydrolase fold-domain-containing protein [Xylariales sp. AK1849]|nr:alpha/beta hydrolase fold-domain-containing protein [Xylariales sp. AK1849]
MASTPVYQPIHPSLRPHLDPEYAAFHDKHIQYVLPSEAEPWDPASRSRPSPLAQGGQRLVRVGSVEDQDLGNFQLRIFTPEGDVPGDKDGSTGWPALVWFHGGGWVLGGLESENGFLRHVCKYVNCVVISVNYRHAPEHVYPAAIDDAVASYQWIMDPVNAKSLQINISSIATGGFSAHTHSGGCLAAILSLKLSALAAVPEPKLQLLLCPVIDNTASVSGIWSSSQHAVWLTPTRMTWYREKYFPNPSYASRWDASPCFAPSGLLGKSPETFLGIAECDLLAPEALRFAESLRSAGVEVEEVVYKGATHSVLVLAGVHQVGQKLVHDACTALAEAIGTSYDADEAAILPPE